MTARSGKETVLADDRGGFAFVVVLLALSVLLGAATWGFLAARGQLAGANTNLHVLRAELAAESGISSGLRHLGSNPVSASRGSRLVDTGSLADVDWEVHARALSPEVVLLEGWGRMESRGVQSSIRRVAWWPDAEVRTRAHQSVIETPFLNRDASSLIDSTSVSLPHPGVPQCSASLSTSLPAVISGWGSLPGLPEWGSEGGGGFDGPRFGWVPFPDLADRSRRVVRGDWDPGGCETCGTGLSFGEAAVSLTGSGRGLLFVQGDVDVRPGVRWRGLIVASGSVRVEGAEVVGGIRSGVAVHLLAGAQIFGSLCAIYQGFTQAPESLRPVPIPGRSWLLP